MTVFPCRPTGKKLNCYISASAGVNRPLAPYYTAAKIDIPREGYWHMISLSTDRPLFLRLVLSGLPAVVFLSGCGEPTTRVSGKVSYRGKPLPSGTITFFCSDNKVVRSCQIGADGSYAIEKVPVGMAKISVSTPPPPPALSAEVAKMAPSGGSTPPKPISIPINYNDPEKSGLTYQVPKGDQPHDIDLK